MTAPTGDGLTQPQTQTSTPSGTTSTGPATAPAPQQAEFRYGEEFPDYLRGRSPAEAAQLLQQAVGVLRQVAVNQPVYQQPAPAAPSNPDTAIGEDDFITGRHLQGLSQQFAQQTIGAVTPVVVQALDLAASSNLDRVREKRADVFARYGHEIYGHLASVPKTAWSIDNLERVVKLVQADHLEEVTRERAERLAASGDLSLRATGAGGLPMTNQAPTPWDSLTDAQRSRLSAKGLKPEVIRENCAKMGMDEAKWYARYAENSVGEGA